MASPDHGTFYPAGDQTAVTTRQQGVTATVLGIAALVVVGFVIIVAVVCNLPSLLSTNMFSRIIKSVYASKLSINPQPKIGTLSNCGPRVQRILTLNTR